MRLPAQQLPLHYYSVKEGLVSNEVHSLLQDSRGYLWVGTSEGVSRFDGVSFTNFTTRDGLSFNYINSIIEPRESPRRRLVRDKRQRYQYMPQNRFTTLEIGDSPELRNVNILFQDHVGTIWIGTDDGIFRMKGGRAEPVARTNARGPVGSITETADGKILFAFSLLLGEFDPITDGSQRGTDPTESRGPYRSHLDG